MDTECFHINAFTYSGRGTMIIIFERLYNLNSEASQITKANKLVRDKVVNR